MAGDNNDQKTAMLGELPPEVKAALNNPQRTMAVGAPAPVQGGGSPSTVMLEAPVLPAGGQAQAPAPRQGAVPEIMRNRPEGPLPPVKRPAKKSSAGRWIGGPLVAIVMAFGTAALARVVMPHKRIDAPPPPKAMGKVKLTTDPAGASLTVDGKAFPRFTPTTVDGEIGSNLHIVFKVDGYKDKESDVLVAEGEKSLAVKLDKEEAAKPEPKVETPTKPEKVDKHKTVAVTKTTKEPAGKGSISIRVRPWAIVYVDGGRIRQTPILNYELSSGKHTIELLNEPKGKREKIPVTIKAGGAEDITRDWDK